MSTTETVRGTGNVFADLGLPDPDAEQAKALIAAEIIIKASAPGQRKAMEAAIARVRRCDLDAFTLPELRQLADSFPEGTL